MLRPSTSNGLESKPLRSVFHSGISLYPVFLTLHPSYPRPSVLPITQSGLPECAALISTAVISTITEYCLGRERVHFILYFTLREVRAEFKQEQRQEPCWKTAYWIAPGSCQLPSLHGPGPSAQGQLFLPWIGPSHIIQQLRSQQTWPEGHLIEAVSQLMSALPRSVTRITKVNCHPEVGSTTISGGK